MPRWAEMIVFAVIGLVLVGGLLVYAKWKTTQGRATDPVAQAVTAEEKPARAAEPADEDEKPVVTAEDLEAAAAIAVAHAEPSPAKQPEAAEPAEAPAGEEPPAEEPPAAEPVADSTSEPETADGVEAPVAGVQAPLDALPGAADGAEGVAPPAEAEKEGAEGAKAAEEGVREEAKPAIRVKRGTREELLLLAHAERALERIAELRLRPELPARHRLEQERRLQAILDALPDETRDELAAWIGETGAGGAEPGGEAAAFDVAGQEAGAAEVGERELGRVPGKPVAVNKLAEKIQAGSQRLGIPRPRAPKPGTRAVNPSAIPAARAAPAGSTIPSAAPSKDLD